MSKHTDSSVGQAGHSAGALVHSGVRRMVLVAAGAVGVVLLAASVAFACTTYWGQITVENLDQGSYEFSVVADPEDGMDRCDEAMADGDDDGDSTNNSSDTGDGVDEIDVADGDTVRVEISKWEPNGEDAGTNPDSGQDERPCNTVGDRDGDGDDEHSLADSTGDGDDVYINHWDGTTDAYADDDNDGVYEDYDHLNGARDGSSNETHGDETTERKEDCMGNGDSNDDGNPDSGTPVVNHDPNNDGTSAIPIITGSGQDAGQFDGNNSKDVTNNGDADEDGDGVNDVDITINFQNMNPGDVSAICVSEEDGGDSAPQVPIEVV